MQAVKISLFFVCLTFFVNLKAQTNFLHGYYVTNNQDTIRGFIEAGTESKNHRICIFKKDLNDEQSLSFEPGSILAYSLADKDFYESHVLTDKNGQDIEGFFHVLIKGKISLLIYYFKAFAKDSENRLYEISKNEEEKDGKIVVDYYGFGILKVLTKDCPDISERELKKAYNDDNFENVFEKYNTCVGSAALRSGKTHIKSHVDFGVLAGFSSAQVKLKSPLTIRGQNKLTYSVGGFMSVFLPRVSSNFRLVLEGSYSYFNHYFYFTNANTNNDLVIKYSNVKVPLIMRYNFKRLFFDVGMQNQFIMSQSTKWRIESLGSSNVVNTSYGQAIPFGSWSRGYLAAVGVQSIIAKSEVRSYLRFSQTVKRNQSSAPVFTNIELCISVILGKKK